MTKVLAMMMLFALTACVGPDQYAANQTCARTAGCISSFSNAGYGPVHAQAAAPDSPSPIQPQQ